jgi:hypothetical protein
MPALRRLGSRTHLLLGVSAILGAGGCGARAVVGPDGGPARARRLAFDVVATLTDRSITPVPGRLPPPVAFTLVLDTTAHRLVLGALGKANAVAATSVGGDTWRASGELAVALPRVGCARAGTVTFRALSIELE